MPIPRSFIDDLVQRCDITEIVGSYVPLKRRGKDLWGLCPFHNEKTPSFHIDTTGQFYYCFGCSKGGGVIDFIMSIEHLNFREAVELLAGRVGMEIPEEDPGDRDRRQRRERILALNKLAARYYFDNLSRPEGAAVVQYIAKRRISKKYAVRFGLGAAPNAWDSLIRAMTAQGYTKADLLDAGLAVAGRNGSVYDKFRNRMMLPVLDLRGSVVGFTSRVMDQSEPKYLNTPETDLFQKRSILYGMNYAKATKRSNFLLVEGNIDVITLHQAGFDNAVATMGTSLTADHIKLLSKYTNELVLCYDNDNAGKDATQRAIGLLKDSSMKVRVLQLPRRKTETGELVKQDADDFIKFQGAAAFEALLNSCTEQTEYRLQVIQDKYDLTDDTQRISFLQEAADMIATLASPVEREVYGTRAASAVHVSPETMAQEIEKARSSQQRRARRKEERQAMTVSGNVQPKQRELRYENIRSARAEEGILRLLLSNPDLFEQVDGLTVEEFSSPFLGRVYQLLQQRRQNDQPIAVGLLSGDLAPEESSRLVQILQTPESGQNAAQALQDYIALVRSEALKRQGSGLDLLMAVRDQKRRQSQTED